MVSVVYPRGYDEYSNKSTVLSTVSQLGRPMEAATYTYKAQQTIDFYDVLKEGIWTKPSSMYNNSQAKSIRQTQLGHFGMQCDAD